MKLKEKIDSEFHLCLDPSAILKVNIFVWQTIWHMGQFSVINWVENVNWPPLRVQRLTFRAIRFDEGRTLETSACKLFKVANLRFQLSW